MSVLSLYIPVISTTVSEQYIIKMFKTHNIGIVLRVDFVKNIKKNRREAFVHFLEWFNNDKSVDLQKDVQNVDTKTKFVYSETGKFWPLLVNKNAHKRVNNPNYEILKINDIVSEYTSSLKLMGKSNNENNMSRKFQVPKRSKSM